MKKTLVFNTLCVSENLIFLITNTREKNQYPTNTKIYHFWVGTGFGRLEPMLV
jgi:hypothetical protein